MTWKVSDERIAHLRTVWFHEVRTQMPTPAFLRQVSHGITQDGKPIAKGDPLHFLLTQVAWLTEQMERRPTIEALIAVQNAKLGSVAATLRKLIHGTVPLTFGTLARAIEQVIKEP